MPSNYVTVESNHGRQDKAVEVTTVWSVDNIGFDDDERLVHDKNLALGVGRE